MGVGIDRQRGWVGESECDMDGLGLGGRVGVECSTGSAGSAGQGC